MLCVLDGPELHPVLIEDTATDLKGDNVSYVTPHRRVILLAAGRVNGWSSRRQSARLRSRKGEQVLQHQDYLSDEKTSDDPKVK